MKSPKFTALLAFFLLVSGTANAAWVWSPESGKFSNPKHDAKDTPDEQFQWAMSFYEDGDIHRALDEFKKLTTAFPNTPMAAEGQFYQGVCFEKIGDIGKASEAFSTLVDRYPYSPRVSDAVEHEYELAEAMLDGKKTKFLGMAIMPAQDTAANLYKHIVKSAPYGPYGVKAQYRLGDAYLALGDLEEAEKAFQAVVDEYPTSELAEKARYQIARVSYRASQQQEYHMSQTDEALRKYEGFKEAEPDSQLTLEANEVISELRQKKAENIYEIGKFYFDRGKFKSARTYLEDVVRNYPDTKVAADAKDRLDRIDAKGEPSKAKKPWWRII